MTTLWNFFVWMIAIGLDLLALLTIVLILLMPWWDEIDEQIFTAHWKMRK